MTSDLHRFFHPEAIAVIGASDTPDRSTTMNWRFAREWADAHRAKIYPVNPFKDEIDGLHSYDSVRDVPGPLDLVIVLLSDPASVAEEVIAAEAAFVIVFSGGFAEVGGDGAQRQASLAELFRGSNTRMLGPNANLNAYEEFRTDLPGPSIALISQSGHQGRPIFQGQEIGIKVSHWIPTGNEADLESADFIEYFADLPETGAVAAYIEGFQDGDSFRRAADHAARRGVPIVMVKVGRTDVGRSWAQSHTGHLAGQDQVVSAVMRQYGVTRVEGLDELLDTATFLARSKPPVAPGVGVYSISGGTSGHLADMLSAAGLPLPPLGEETQRQLREWIPDYLRIGNPVDNGGHPVGDWRGVRILETMIADPAIGVLVVPITGAFPPFSDHLVRDVVEIAKTTDKPICVIWGSPVGTESAYRDILCNSELTTFRTFRNCVGALRAYFDFHAFRGRYPTSPAPDSARPSGLGAQGRTQLGSPGAQSEPAAKALLRGYGIDTTRDLLTTSVDEALQAAEELGYPVVMKIASAAIAHKSDLSLVRVGVASAGEVREAFTEMMLRAATVAEGEIDGVLVCEQVSDGVEVIVGITTDELFGPTVMVGLGGVSVEVYRDVAFRVPPFDLDEAHRMLRELRAFELLTGFRGRPAVDLNALAETILKVQQLAVDLKGELVELDINPLLALPDRVVALDALAITHTPHGDRGADAGGDG